MLQVLICSVLALSFICHVQYVAETNSIVKSANAQKAYYLYLYDQFVENDEVNGTLGKTSPFVYEKLGSVKQISGIGEVKNYLCSYEYQGKENNFLCYTYNQPLIENMKCPLQAGVWFNQYTGGDPAAIPIVVSGDTRLHIGDTLEMRISNPNSGDTQGMHCNVRVIGILNGLNYLYSFTAGGTRMGLGMLLEKDSSIVILPEERLEPSLRAASMDQLGRMLFVSGKSDAVFSSIKSLSLGNLADVSEMNRVTDADFDTFLISNGIVLLVLTFITAAGIGGGNSLQRMTNEKVFSVFYMVGASWKQCVRIELWRSLMIVGVPFAAFLLFYRLHIFDEFLPADAIITSATFLSVLIYIALLYAATSLYSMVSTARMNPVEVIRKWE